MNQLHANPIQTVRTWTQTARGLIRHAERLEAQAGKLQSVKSLSVKAQLLNEAQQLRNAAARIRARIDGLPTDKMVTL